MTLQNNKLKKYIIKWLRNNNNKTKQKINRLKPDPYCVSGNLLCHTAPNLGTPEGPVTGPVIYKIWWILDFTTTSTWTEDKLLSERRWHRLELGAAFRSRVLSNIMPKWTLTPILQSRFFPLEHTSRVVVSYIPERRVEAEEQRQGTAGVCRGTGTTDTLYLVFPSGHIQEYPRTRWNVEWQNGHGTPWYSLGKFEK